MREFSEGSVASVENDVPCICLTTKTPPPPPPPPRQSEADRILARLERKDPKLRTITLTGCDVNEDNVDEFAAALGLQHTSVTYLALFCLQAAESPLGAALLATAAVSLPNLRIFNWGNFSSSAEHDVVRILSRGLRHHKCSLNRVMLGSSSLETDGAIILMEVMEENRSVVALGLEDCDITDEGAEAVAKMLKRNGVLQTLGMSENDDITDRGAAALLEAIFDTTDGVDSLWSSNHTVISFSRDVPSCRDDGGEEPLFPSASPKLNRNIARVLEINRSSGNPSEVARRKIALHMEQSFDSTCMEGVNEGSMPHVLSWCGPTSRYEILRSMPDLVAARTLGLGEEAKCARKPALKNECQQRPSSETESHQETLIKEGISAVSPPLSTDAHVSVGQQDRAQDESHCHPHTPRSMSDATKVSPRIMNLIRMRRQLALGMRRGGDSAVRTAENTTAPRR